MNLTFESLVHLNLLLFPRCYPELGRTTTTTLRHGHFSRLGNDTRNLQEDVWRRVE